MIVIGIVIIISLTVIINSLISLCHFDFMTFDIVLSVIVIVIAKIGHPSIIKHFHKIVFYQ